jgi:integrase
MVVKVLTTELVQALECPFGRGHLEVFDEELKGFYLDLLSSGRKTYRLRFRQDGIKKLQTLGDASVISLVVARSLAAEHLQHIKSLLPIALVKQARASKKTIFVKGLSTTEFLQLQYLPYVRSYKKSWKSDESMIRVHIIPLVGHLVMAKVTALQIAGFIEEMKHKELAPGTINRALVLLQYAFKLGQRWEVPGVSLQVWNGIRHLKNDNRIERYLTTEQAHQLLEAVRESLNPLLPFIVALLIYTGARKREVLDLKWSDLDWVQKSWKISKNKSNKIRHVPLSYGALETVEAVRATRPKNCVNEYVFTNPRTGKPFSSVFFAWDAARKRAAMPELRVHDLRHSFASFLVNAGRSLYEVQELLGHADIKTTSRYSHLSRDRLNAAVECVPHI